MSKWKDLWTPKAQMLVLGFAVAGLIAFGTISQSVTTCEAVKVQLDNTIDNHFHDEQSIIDMATLKGEWPLVGKEFTSIQLKNIEENLRSDSFIADCETFRDLEGNILIQVRLERPVARIVRRNGADAYITQEGKILPVSDKFVSRVMLIHADKNDSLVHEVFYAGKEGEKILKLINTVFQNEFWKAQLAEMYVGKENEIVFLPQVTKQLIEFGTADRMEAKLKKLKRFYKDILPVKGWNVYHRVNVEFEDQIIAE